MNDDRLERTALIRAPLLRSLLLPLGVVCVVLAFWSPYLAEGLHAREFPGHVALVRVLSDMLAADPSLPLWNGREYSGTSLVIAYLHPIGSLLLLSPFTLVFGAERGIEMGSVFYLSLAALSMYAWCFFWGASRAGAALGALVYVLHPPVFGFVGFGGQMHQPVTLAILPLVFLAWMRLAAEPALGRVVVAALASALLLLDMQRFFLAMPFVLLVYLATSRRTGPSLGAAAGVLLGVGLLLCFPVLPILEERSLLQWHAPEALASWRERYSLGHALQLIDRNGLFSSVLSALPVAKTDARPGGWYQGVVALAFVAFGSLWVARGALDPTRRLRLAVTCACWPVVVALAFGPRRLFTTQAELAGHLLTAGAAGALALAALLAIALVWVASLWWLRTELLARWPARRLQVDGVLLGVALFLGLAIPFELLSRGIFVYGHMRAPAHFAFPLLGFVLGSAVCLVAPAWGRVAGTPGRAAAVFLVTASLHLIDVRPYASLVAPQIPPSTEATLHEAFRSLAHRPAGRVLDVSGSSPLTDMLAPAEAARASAWGWLPWTGMRHTSELMTGGLRSLAAGDVEQAAQVAGLANIRFFSQIAYSGGRLPKSEALAPVFRDRHVILAENLRVLPYAQLYPEVAWVSGGIERRLPLVALLARAGIASYTFDPLSDAPRPERRPDFAAGSEARRLAPGVRRVPKGLESLEREVSAPCETERARDVEVRLRCRFESTGYLVVAESWSPRWSVRIDGEQRPLLRLNHAFQGVAVAAGDEQIRFRYEPSPVTRASIAISALCWLSLLGFGAVALLRRR